MTRISELRLPLGVPVSGRHNSQKNIHSRGPHIHSKVAYGSGEHDAIRASPLWRRISELRPPLGVPVSGRHNSQNIHSREPHIHSKDAYGSGEHDATWASPLWRRIYELRPPLGVPVSGRDNLQKNIHSRGPHIHSKVAYGSGGHGAIRASPLWRRISELRPKLCVPVSGRHNSQKIHSRGPHMHSKDAYGSGEHDVTQASPLWRASLSYAFH